MSSIRNLLEGKTSDLPRRFFLDRRKGRHLLNGDAVRQELAEQGFTTVYAEDLSLEEQLALFMRAEDIVAIHGAGLAPILYRTAEDGPFRLIEILSPGHMTLMFRALATELPVDYRAIRGNPDGRMFADAYRVTDTVSPFIGQHSLEPFFLDLSALKLALQGRSIEEAVRIPHGY